MSRGTHNANYMYDVDGETVWEKLRVIRSFLSEKEIILAENELLIKDLEKKHSTIDKDSFEYKKYLLHEPRQKDLLEELVGEIKFLKEFEAWLAVEAEKTRIPGKTDDEMYEINFFDELKIRLVRRAQMQYISTGHVDPDTLMRIAKNKSALLLAIETGVLNEAVLGFVGTIPMLEHSIPLLENKND